MELQFIGNARQQYFAKRTILFPLFHAQFRARQSRERVVVLIARLETRKLLPGNMTEDITSHYSAPELAELIRAAIESTDSGKRHTICSVRPAPLPLRRSSFRGRDRSRQPQARGHRACIAPCNRVLRFHRRSLTRPTSPHDPRN
jgi:hypothetical protein